MSTTGPRLVARSVDVVRGTGTGGPDDNFPVGCRFSPDGLCVLTATCGDSRLRLYNTVPTGDAGEGDGDGRDGVGDPPVHPWRTAVSADGGDAVRCYDWYPSMRSDDPSTCCFVATARNQPIHLYDAYSGLVRATYRAYNALDEMESAMVVAFDPTGSRLAAGGFRGADQRTLHLFEAAVPGRASTTLRLGQTRRSLDGQKGLVSALAYGGTGHLQGLLAVGTYAPGSIYVYDPRAGVQPSGAVLRDGHCVVGCRSEREGWNRGKRKRFAPDWEPPADAASDDGDGEGPSTAPQTWLTSAKSGWFQRRARRGVTQLRFGGTSQDCTLYSASRRSGAILAWDLRMLSSQPDRAAPCDAIQGSASYATDNDTNQRLEFDLDEAGETLFVAGRDNCVRIYDTKSGTLRQPIVQLEDTANGISCSHGASSNGYLAVAVGARHFPSVDASDEEPSPGSENGAAPGYLSLYRLR